MLRKTKNKPQTLSEKVAELILHPNGNEGSEGSDSEDNTAPRVADFDDEYEQPEARSTDIRKRNVKLLSEQSTRYRGKLASRKDFEVQEDEDSDENDNNEKESASDSESESDDGALEAFSKQLKNSKYENGNDKDDATDSEKEDGKADSDNDEEGEESEDDDDESEDPEEEDEDVENAEANEMVAETNRQAEVQKGMCVQSQLRIWERLLELRINSQKLLSKTNQLPAPNEFRQHQQENEVFKSAANETSEKVGGLLKSLIDLQHALSGQFSELRNSLKTTSLKRPSPFHGHKSDTPPPIKRIAEHLNQHFKEFQPYRNTVLLKWDDRTKLLTPGAGAKKKTMNEEFDVIRKVENTLMNRSALIEKSQISKNNQMPTAAQISSSNGNGPNDTDIRHNSSHRDVNVYDDSDFYHQQLRELIEYKANTSSSMTEVTQQYVELQKLRQKMKRKVDTRASKGRKLRYVVHNKLVNFMAPDDTVSTWTDDSKNELCKSLFAS